MFCVHASYSTYALTLQHPKKRRKKPQLYVKLLLKTVINVTAKEQRSRVDDAKEASVTFDPSETRMWTSRLAV